MVTVGFMWKGRSPAQRLERWETPVKNLVALPTGERKRKGNHSPIFTLCCGCFRMSSTIWQAASCWEGRTSSGLQLVLSRYKVWICFPRLRAGSFSMDGVYRKSPRGKETKDRSRISRLQQQMGMCLLACGKLSWSLALN